MRFNMKTIFLAAILNVCSALDDWTIIGSSMNGLDVNHYDGDSISLSSDGKRVAIIINSANDYSFIVRMFEYNGDDWEQFGGTIEGGMKSYNSHVSMSFDGTRVAIGAVGTSDSIGCYVHVYEYNGSSWELMGGDAYKMDNHFGCGKYVSLSLDGTRVAFSDARSSPNNNYNAGHVSVIKYDATQNNWQPMGQIINGEYEGEKCCVISLSPDGTKLALGSPKHGENDAGKASMFEFDGANWIKMGGDIIGGAADDNLGSSVSLSLDGSIVAIGVKGHDTTNNGLVRVLKYNGSDWEQRGLDISGTEPGGAFGSRLSLSSDGTRVAVSSEEADGSNGEDSGQVRVFDYDENKGVWEQGK